MGVTKDQKLQIEIVSALLSVRSIGRSALYCKERPDMEAAARSRLIDMILSECENAEDRLNASLNLHGEHFNKK